MGGCGESVWLLFLRNVQHILQTDHPLGLTGRLTRFPFFGSLLYHQHFNNMSAFDFPRINIKGLIAVNVGTGNNDDYSINYYNAAANPPTFSGTTVPPNPPGGFGQSLRIADSATVQPYDFLKPGTNRVMTDTEMMEWMQNPQDFTTWNKSVTPQPSRMIPGEWNYYGSMGMNMMQTSVVGVSVPNAQRNGSIVYTSNDPFGLMGGVMSFNNRPDATGRSTAVMVDVNPEAPPASQVFTDNLMLQVGQNIIFNAKPTKAITRWINFQRNTLLNGPNGAAGTFQCVIPLSDLEGQAIVPILQAYALPGKTLAGLVFRYTLFRSLQQINTFKYADPEWLAAVTALYTRQGLNPAYVQISGTVAPWYEGELQSMFTGHFLTPGKATFYSPGGNTAPGGGPFSLAPAMVQANTAQTMVSIDLTASLPDAYNDTQYDPLNTQTNPKYDLGPLTFCQRTGGLLTPIGAIDYLDTSAGDAAGWIFDYPVGPDLHTSGPQEQQGATIAAETVEIVWPQYVVHSPRLGTDLLAEQREFLVSDQSGIYAEQSLPGQPSTTSTFVSQGYPGGAASFQAYIWGQQDTSTPYDIWMANVTYVKPPAFPPLPVKIMSGYRPGTPLTVPVDTAGVFILTIATPGQTPEQVNDMLGDMMVAPMINCRILPNYDYSRYYTMVNGEPVATAALDFNVLYAEVFRNYYLLYPAMSQIIPMNDPNQWIGPTCYALLDRVSEAAWDGFNCMPRTRDLSQTRRWLVQAYAVKYATMSPNEPTA